MPPEGFEETTDQLRNPYKSDLSFVGKPGEQKIIDRISAQGFDGIRTPDGRNFKLQDDRKNEGLSHYMPAETIRKEGERLGLKYQREEEGTHLFRDPISKQDIKVPQDAPRGTIVKQVNDARAKNLADSMGFMPAPPPETPKFKEWFKDSKVVDESGKPKIVLHGTASDFYAFKKDRLGAATGQVDTPLGFFFTEDPAGANYFARSAGYKNTGMDKYKAYEEEGPVDKNGDLIPQGAAIIPAVLSIQKPYVFDTPQDFSREMFGPMTMFGFNKHSPDEILSLKKKLISQGYDGIKIIKGGHYMMGEDPNSDVWVAFDPKQIKSAIGNRGTWSTRTSNITFMPSDLPEDRQSAVVDLKKQINTINNKLQRYVSDQKNPEALKLSDQKISLWRDIHKLRRGAVRDFGVVGSGPAGLESAASSAYEGLDTVLVDKNVRLGGQPKDSSRIENLYGTPQEGITGPEMTRNAVQKAKANGAEIRAGVGVKSLDYDPETGIKTLTYTNGEKERFHNVQISIGNEFRALDIPGAQYADNGNGRMAALHARGGNAIIVGGGNSASQAAIGAVEAGGVNHVYLFARSGLKGMSTSQAEQIAAHPNITVVKDELAAISKKGDDLTVKTKNGDSYNVKAVGTFVGGKPNTEWLPKEIQTDPQGKIVTGANGETSIPGVFVAGDARSGSLPRINAASAQGQAVSAEVVRRITEKEKSWNKNNTSQIGTGSTISQPKNETNTSGLNKATLGDTRTLATTTTEFSPAKGSAMPSEPTVNIGLNVNDGSKITPEEAISELEKQGVKITKQSVEQSNTEPTLIASLSRPLTPEEADKVSRNLKQDAIAQFDGNKGELYGPKAEDWKPFNPDYFLNHKSSFMPSDVSDAVVNLPLYPSERETGMLDDGTTVYKTTNKARTVNQGKAFGGWEAMDREFEGGDPTKPSELTLDKLRPPTDVTFTDASSSDAAKFMKTKNPMVIVGHDLGGGDMWWNPDSVNQARKEGFDSVVVVSEKAIPPRYIEANYKGAPLSEYSQRRYEAIKDAILKNPDKVDWEHQNNLVIPLDESRLDKMPGHNPDEVLDQFNRGDITKDQMKSKLGNFMPANNGPVGAAKEITAKSHEELSKATDKEFWTKAWPKVLKQTGLTLSPKNEKNINLAAKQVVTEVGDFLKDNPKFADYYNSDWKETKNHLDNYYGRKLTDDEFEFFKIAEGLTSPNTSLAINTADAFNALNLRIKDGNLGAIKMGVSPKGNRVLSESPISLSGTTNGIKAFTLKAVDKLAQDLGSVRAATKYLMEPVSVKELEEFNKSLGYKGKVGKLNNIKELVEQATGQSEKIPRMFVFGRKVGAYTLNLLGDHRFNTVDIWESRFIRSQFTGMLKEHYGAPVDADEHTLFTKFTNAFNEEFRKETGLNLDNSALQAARWFYMIDAVRKSGYSATTTGETISHYAKEHLDAIRNGNKKSGTESPAENPQEQRGASPSVVPTHRRRNLARAKVTSKSLAGSRVDDELQRRGIASATM
jgi:thioredoxin reductase